MDLAFTEDNDISFKVVTGDDYVRQLMYHAIMTRHGELAQDPNYGSKILSMRIKNTVSGLNSLAGECIIAMRKCPIVASVMQADIYIIQGDYVLYYTIRTRDGRTISDKLQWDSDSKRMLVTDDGILLVTEEGNPLML